jgi:hypothetical protein
VGTGLLLPDMGVESVNHCCSWPISYQCYLPVCKSLIIDVVIKCSEPRWSRWPPSVSVLKMECCYQVCTLVRCKSADIKSLFLNRLRVWWWGCSTLSISRRFVVRSLPASHVVHCCLPNAVIGSQCSVEELWAHNLLGYGQQLYLWTRHTKVYRW